MESLLATLALTPMDGIMIPVCAVLFGLFIKLLDVWFFKPYLALLEAREAATSGAQDQAHDLNQKADALAKEYETRLMDSRVDFISRKLSKVTSARNEAAKISTEAQNTANQALEKGRGVLASDMSALRQACSADADAMAGEIVRKVLTGAGSGSGTQHS